MKASIPRLGRSLIDCGNRCATPKMVSGYFDQNVEVNGRLVASRGSVVTAQVAATADGSGLTLQLTDIMINNQKAPLSTLSSPRPTLPRMTRR